MKFTLLSLDSQLAILSQLPSHTLLNTIPLVCARWHRLQPHACLQRRTVKLIIRPNAPVAKVESYLFNLYPASLDASYVAALSTTFPNVTHLDISHHNLGFEALDPQLHLLKSWAPTLIRFNLSTNADEQAATQGQLSPQFNVFLGRLLALLCQMPRLKQLHLIIIGQLPPSVDLSSILGRLVDVGLNFIHSEHILVRQLLQHSSPNMSHLSLGFIDHFPTFLPLLTNSTICSKLVNFRVANFDATQLAITFDHCSRIQALALTLQTLDEYANRVHLLTKLPVLTVLALSIEQVTIPVEPVIADVPTTPLPTLSSICQLLISVNSLPSHEHFIETFKLDQVFPQLQRFRLDWYTDPVTCQQCRADNRKLESCIDALLQPVARIETLQLVNVGMMGKSSEGIYNWLPRLRRQ